MLEELRIQDFGIIDDLRLGAGPGLTVLTGETGAGKSLIIQSLMAILGCRVGAGMVRSGASRAIIEARFRIGPDLQKELPQASEDLTIRREIQQDGKSKVLLNGTASSLTLLRSLSVHLMDLHGQHEQQRFLDSDHQLESLDAYCDAGQLRRQVLELYQTWFALKKKLRAVRMQKEERDFRLDYLHTAVKDIDQLHPLEGEYEQLMSERELMQHGGKLFEDLHVCSQLLSGEEHSVLSGLAGIQVLVERHLKLLPDLQSGLADLSESNALLEGFSESMRRQMDRLQFSPERLEDVEERLQLYRRLQKRFGATVSLSKVRDEYLMEIGELESVEENERKISEDLNKAEKSLCQTAELLSRLRRSCLPALESRMADELGALGMTGATITVSISREVEATGSGEDSESQRFVLTDKGFDRVEFYFRPNPGEPAQPLRKIASGGELSRIMLACRTIMLEQKPVPVIVFDEVDSGVGGEIAHTLAERLRVLARQSQVLVVTHLPQVAVCADQHFKIFKKQENGRTVSRLSKLGREPRIQEIARMMGGDKAMEFAREYLAHAS